MLWLIKILLPVQCALIASYITPPHMLYFSKKSKKFGSGALSGIMLLVRIIENDKVDAILDQVRLALSRRVRKS